MKSMKSTQKKILLVVTSILLVVWALVTVIPMYWMLVGSVQDSAMSASFKPQMIPEQLSLSPYERFFAKTDAWRWLYNSLLISIILTVTNVFFASLAGYAFAKLKFPGSQAVFWTLLGTMMIPAQVTLIPLYILMVNVFDLGIRIRPLFCLLPLA